jgi:hypothetical protein
MQVTVENDIIRVVATSGHQILVGAGHGLQVVSHMLTAAGLSFLKENVLIKKSKLVALRKSAVLGVKYTHDNVHWTVCDEHICDGASSLLIPLTLGRPPSLSTQV